MKQDKQIRNVINLINKKIRVNLKTIKDYEKSKYYMRDWANAVIFLENDVLKRLREEIKKESKTWKINL